MTETTDTRADSTRQQILRAAARQFARLPYHQVGLDDVLAEAELTKGAMYFHFRSKHALALAVIDDQTTRSNEAVRRSVGTKFSGLETLIDFSYQLAARDMSDDMSRAALHLVESIGRIEDLQATLLKAWIDNLAVEPCSAASARATSRGLRPARRWTPAGVDLHGTAPDQLTWTNPSVSSATSRSCLGLDAARLRASRPDRLLPSVHQTSHEHCDREYVRVSGFEVITRSTTNR